MWAFDDSPEEYCYMVDGTAEAYMLLKYAMAILVEASDKIIYFPCKQEGIGNYYKDNYNLILCTPKAKLRRSLWIAIRRKLTPATKIRSYVLQYDRKKLDDFCKKKLLRKEWQCLKGEDYFLRPEIRKNIEREHIEELVGENLFFVLGKEECYHNHYLIAKDLDEYCADERYGVWTALGWIITARGLKSMQDNKTN